MAEPRRQRNKPSTFPAHATSSGLRELVRLSPDALLIVNPLGTIVMASEQTAALFGYRLEELAELPLEALLPEHLRALHLKHRQQYVSAPRTRAMGAGLDLVGRRKDGSEFPVDISLRPVLLHDEQLTIGAIRDVSEQRRAERERAQVVAQLRLQTELVELSHDAILVRDPISRVLSWNKGAEQLYGWSAQEALGRITHSLLNTHFPVSRAEVDVHLERLGYWEGELVHTRRDGMTLLVESRQVLVRDETGAPSALLEINRDITERRRLEQAAHALQVQTTARLDFLQQIIDALPNSVYLVYGQDARLLLANRATASLWAAEWTIDQPLAAFLEHAGISIMSEQGRPLALEDLATIRALRERETVRHLQETIRRPNLTSLPVLVNAVVLDSSGGWQILRQHTEDERATQHALTEAAALVVHQDVSTLKESEYLKDEFIGIAAHELRNPLAVLKGFAEMLLYQTARGRGQQLADWQREALEEIDEATLRLDKLTEDLLDVTRLQAGRLTLSRTPTDLVELARRLIAQRQLTTQRHRISLETTLSSLVLEVDRARIEQVLTNLLSNAIKYSPQGGSIELTIRVEREQSVVLLSIRDQGIGIPAQQQARLFGRFVRAENARTSEITGTGLGLYLSRELVERHGGRLWFESAEGIGSIFYLALPLP